MRAFRMGVEAEEFLAELMTTEPLKDLVTTAEQRVAIIDTLNASGVSGIIDIHADLEVCLLH